MCIRDSSPDLGLAEAYLQSGQYHGALEEFSRLSQKAYHATHDSPIAWGRAQRGRARALVLLGRHEEAVRAFEEALRMDLRGDLRYGGAVQDCLELTSVHRHLGDESQAEQALQQARVVAVRPSHHAMIDAFIEGSPIPVDHARWSDIPLPAKGGPLARSG